MTRTMADTAADAGRRHTAGELSRLLGRLDGLLQKQRRRGRTPEADAVGGMAIEDGEAEGLVGELADALARPPAGVAIVGRADGVFEAGGPASAGEGFLPLLHAARAFDLRGADYLALLLALAVETDARFGRLVAYLNDHAGHTRPTVGLALALAEADETPSEFCGRPVLCDGLLELDGDGPLPGRELRLSYGMPTRLSAGALRGPEDTGVRFFRADGSLLGRLVLDDSQRQALTAWSGRIRAGEARRPLLLPGAAGSGRGTAARAAAGAAGLPTVEVDLAVGPATAAERVRLARREARWYGAALLLRLPAEGLDARAVWEGLAGFEAPVLMAVAPGGAEAAGAAAPVEPAVIACPEPTRAARERLWHALLPPGSGVGDDDCRQLAARFRFGPGRTARALRRAGADASLAAPGSAPLTAAGLERACREVGSALMGPLAQKLALPYGRDDLVVPDTLTAELDLAVAWVTHQGRVLDDWGFGGRVAAGRGLTALFAGPPGTGKTMAAQVLARALAMELYRVDLSRVMSKWIGETEKNLASLFDEAQTAGAVLFFDEADALFGKRSEVKDARDRYANLEVGYLLQRMEDHDGVTVLATNRADDLDDAFLRRFHFLLDFPLPDEARRLRIWEGMFPASAEREPGLDLARLARDFELSGGEIKNVVLAAAFLAASEGRPVGMRHLASAVAREYRKSGKTLDARKLAGVSAECR